MPEGQKQITRQPLAPRQQPGIFSTAVSRASQEFAQTAANVAKQFEEAATLAEKTNASTEALRKLKELNLEAESARTIESISKFKSDYPNRINKIREEANKLITLPQAKNEFGRSFDRDKLLFDFSIRSTLQKNQNVMLESVLNENIIEQRDSFITGNPIMQQTAETNRDILLADAVSRGILTTKEARTQKDKQKKEWRLAKIDADIEGDAEFALEQLQLGEKGIYAETDAGDRLTKETKANTKLERNKKVAEKITNEKHTKNEIDLTQKYFTNELFFEDIQGQFVGGDISQKYAGVLNTLLTSPDAVDARPSEKENKFDTLITEYLNLDEADLDDLRKFRIKVLGFHAAGLLSRPDAEFLVNKTVDPFTQAKVEGKGFLAATIEAIRNWAEMAITPVSSMLNKFLSRVDEKSTEEVITKAGQDIIKEQIKEDNPDIGVLADTPNTIFDNQKGFDNVNNQPSQAESQWEFRDGKLIRIEAKKPVKKKE